MTRTTVLAVLTLGLAGMAATTLAPPNHAAATRLPASPRSPAKKCNLHGYTQGHCIIVPRSGRFLVTTPGIAAVLQGYGTPRAAGTQITTAKVANPCPSTKANAFQLYADGPIPPLTLSTAGTLYVYNYGTNTCTQISTITGRGVYEVVYPGGSAPATSHQKAHTKGRSHPKRKAAPGFRGRR
jgi:hypothetical protein